MKKFILLFASILSFYLGNAQQGKQGSQNEYVANRVIVKFKTGIPAETLAAFKAQIRKEIQTTKTKSLKLIDAEVWEFSKGKVQDVIAKWKNDPRIKYIEPDYIVHGSTVPNDPLFSSLWGMTKIQASQAWDATTGNNVVIGVIDAGVDYNHPDLAANMWTNPGEIAGNGIDDDNNGYIDDVHGYDFINNDGDPMDDLDHGTHVAGTIAAKGNNSIGVVGVNWTAKIMALKFIGSNNFGATSDAIRAVQYATQMGARLTNNSWGGGGYSQALYDAINAAGAANILFVAAAGNNGTNNDLYPYYAYPSSYDLDNIIAVAATDVNDLKASFSDYGATTVDLGAPGVDILSTFPTWHPNGPYYSISGTSMASPHVAGVAALIWSLHPDFSTEDIKAIILGSVDPIASLNGITVSGGRLNAFKAITLSQTWTPLLPPKITVSPRKFSITLNPDSSASRTLSISNRAAAKSLKWNIDTPACSWLSLNTYSGITASGATSQIQLNVNTFNLAAGNYQCMLNINSNDPTKPIVQDTVNLTVKLLPSPVASVAPASISFSLKNGQSKYDQLIIKNNAAPGSQNLHWSVSLQGSNIGWLSASPLSGVTGAQNSQVMQVTANATGVAGGTYQAVINITTNDPANPNIQIPVTLLVADPVIGGQKLYSLIYTGGTMKRSDLDGSNVDTVHSGLTNPISVAVDAINRKVYWSDLQTNTIYRSNLNGTNKEIVLSGLTAPISIALDPANSYIYWIESYPSQRIRRAKFDGTGTIDLWNIKGQNANSLSLDIAGGKMYWLEGFEYYTNPNGVWRANLDGSNPQKILAATAGLYGQGDPKGLALDLVHSKLYWGENYPDPVIHKTNLDGSGDQVLATGSAPYYLNSLAVDPNGGKIYWSDPDSSIIYRANTDGTSEESLNLAGQSLALDLSPAAAPELSINNVILAEGNSASAAYNFTVSLSSPAPVGGVTFNIATADNTATTANSDYVAKSLTSQTIPAGSSTYNFSVTVNGDIAVEPNETFFVNVTNVTGATVSDGQGLGTITNDDINGCTPPVIADPKVTQPSCLVPTGTITVKATAASTMQYSIDNGASFKNTATFKSLAVGSYNIVVRLSATPDCKAAYANNPVIINPVPALVAPTAIIGPAGVCRNSTNQVFSVAPVAGAASYQWTLPNGATGSSTKDSILLSFNASYVSGDICVKAINACGQSPSFCRQIKYYDAKPSTPGAIAGQTVGLCSNQTYSIAPLPNATTYNWVIPANTTIKSGQGTTQIVLSFLSGFASGTLSVTASNCNGSSAAQSVQLSRNPETPASIAGPVSAVCAGSTQNYSCALSTGATVYTWKVPTTAVINSGQGTNAISVTFGASFVQGSILVTAGTSCATKSPAKSISVTSKPAVPAAIAGPASVCPQATGLKYNTTAVTGVTYNWLVPNGATIIAGQGTAAITVNMGTLAGNVRVSGSNACGTSSFQSLAVSLLSCKSTVANSIKTGQTPSGALPDVRISPNPATGILYVQLSGYAGNVTLQLRSLEGKVLMQQKLSMSQSITAQQKMDVSTLSSGIYLLTVNDQKGNIKTEKVIIER